MNKRKADILSELLPPPNAVVFERGELGLLSGPVRLLQVGLGRRRTIGGVAQQRGRERVGTKSVGALF